MVPIACVINRLANIATNAVTGNGLPRHALGNAQILRHRRQQADRQELDGDQAGDAECHGRKTADQLGRETSLACGVVVGWYVLSWHHLKIKTCGKVAQFIIKSVTNLTFRQLVLKGGGGRHAPAYGL